MSFSIGDKVIFVNQSRDGIVIKIKDDNILIIESDGIKFEVCKDEIIKVNKESESFYKAIKEIKTSKKQIEFYNKTPEKSNQDYKVLISKDFELDLHIEKIIDNFKHLSSSEILDIQMNVFYKAIFKANDLKLPFLIVIHGLGKGVLKSKITKFLKDNDASFFEESPLFYKGGATRINLF